MADRHYDRPPLVEAVIDVLVTLSEGFTAKQLDELQETLRTDYPNRTELRQFSVAIGAPGQLPQLTSGSDLRTGLRLTKADSSRVVQVQRKEFTFAHLPPYSSWEPFRDEARRIWPDFVRICRPTRVARCSVRYINRVDIPGEQIEIDDYFNVYPELPEEISNVLSSSTMRVEVPQQDIGAHAIIQHALVDAVKPGTIAVLLDLDVLKQCDIDPMDDALWANLDLLRDRKNALFEACITDKTRSLIQ